MKVSTAARLAVIVAAFQLLAGCGSGTPPPATPTTPPSPAALNGNWNLLGNRQLQQYPLLSLALFVDGNRITAWGDELVICPNGSVGGGTVALAGQIAADGNFEMDDAGSQDEFTFVITGTAPRSGSSSWAGTYSLTSAPTSTPCSINQGASFTATALAPVNGTYTGTLFAGLVSSPTAAATVSVNLSQGPAVTLQPPSMSYLPVSGAITVTGSPCFTRGTSTPPDVDVIVEGDVLFMKFDMDDGSQAAFTANFSSPDESALQTTFYAYTGACSGQNAYGGTLTR